MITHILLSYTKQFHHKNLTFSPLLYLHVSDWQADNRGSDRVDFGGKTKPGSKHTEAWEITGI